MWFIVFFMATMEPFAVKTLEFDVRHECVDYVNDPANSNRLAIEVIAKAGFNDEILAVVCLPASDIPEPEKESA